MTVELFDLPTWHDNAACKGSEPDVFFPPKGHWGTADEAKGICAGCSVNVECGEYALSPEIKFGVWGGTTEKERRRIRREQA